MKNSSFFLKKEFAEPIGHGNIEKEVLRPFEKLQKFLVEEYIPNTRPGMEESYIYFLQNNLKFIIFKTLRDSQQQSPQWKGVLPEMSEVSHLHQHDWSAINVFLRKYFS